MNDFTDKLKKQGQNVHLLQSEKQAIKDKILSLPIQEPSNRGVLSFFDLFYSKKLVGMAAFAFILLGSIPATYAAQKSGPGDFLHGFELSVVEPLQSIIHFSPQAQVSYSTRRLEERLDELQSTPNEEMTDEQIAIASENIQEYTNEALVVVPESSKKEIINQLIKVSALLNANEDVIARTKQNEPIIATITDQVEGQLSDQIELYAQGQAPADLAETVQQEVRATTEILEDQAQSPDTITITKLLEEAQKDISAGDLEEALQDVIDAKVQAIAQDYYASGRAMIQ